MFGLILQIGGDLLDARSLHRMMRQRNPPMHLTEDIQRVDRLLSEVPIPLPKSAGVYAFWWIGRREEQLSANRRIVLKGPGGGEPADVYYGDWWPSELEYSCLYVGKSTNIKQRFSWHIKNGSTGRLHAPLHGNMKAKPATTSCQLRHGIEHVFPLEADPLSLIRANVGFSWNTDFPENAIAERFFEEDKLVGLWRPWFNIDSER